MTKHRLLAKDRKYIKEKKYANYKEKRPNN